MSGRGFGILVGATAVVLVALGLMQFSGGSGRDRSGELPERLAPGLGERINEADAIEIQTGVQTVRLERDETGWRSASLAGYPAKLEAVKQALVGLSELEPRERKTDDAGRLARIGLAEPGAGSDALGVTVFAGGETIASLVLGNQVGPAGEQRFARLAGESQAFTVEGRVTIPTEPLEWVDRELLRIGRDRVESLTIEHPDGQVVSLIREVEGSGFRLASVPESRVPKPAATLNAPPNSLSFLRFENVARGESSSSPEVVVSRFGLRNGLVVIVRTWEVDGVVWAAFAFEAGDAVADTSPDEQEAVTPEKPSPIEEAEELRARVSGWHFALPDFQADSLRRRLEDLTDEPPQSEADPAPEAAEPPQAPMRDAVDQPGGG